MEVRPIGVLQMVDQGKRDEKILAVAQSDPLYRQINDASQAPQHQLREIEHFFSIYKYLEDKRTEIAGWGDAEEARKIIREGMKNFK
jgi:inorganic pyrophosphatase